MTRRKAQHGFTLIELMLVAAGISLIMVAWVQFQTQQILDRRAATAGAALAQYNNAVRAFLAQNPGATGTYNGTDWLKPTTCGGTASQPYLPCTFRDALPAFPGLDFSTTISTSGSITEAVTTIGPVELNGEIQGVLASTIASVAASNGMMGVGPSAGTFAMYDSDILTAIVTARASTAPNVDAWLRTDGSNMMNADLTFNPTIAWGDREIRNVYRVFARQFFDEDNTAYYLDPSSSSQLNDVRANIFRDRADPGNRYVDPASTSRLNALRARIVYDDDNTAYYMDLNASTSLRTAGRIISGGDVEASGSVVAAAHLRGGGNLYLDTGGDTSAVYGAGGSRMHLFSNGNVGLNYNGGGDVHIGGGGNASNLYVDNVFLRDKGAWVSDLLPPLIPMNSKVVDDGDYVSWPPCKAGGTPLVYVYPLRINTRHGSPSTTTWAIFAQNQTSYSRWRIRMRSYVSGSNYDGGRGLAMTYCWRP